MMYPDPFRPYKDDFDSHTSRAFCIIVFSTTFGIMMWGGGGGGGRGAGVFGVEAPAYWIDSVILYIMVLLTNFMH